MTENHSNRKCEISVENRDFFIPLAFGAPLWEGGSLSEYRHSVWCGKSRMGAANLWSYAGVSNNCCATCKKHCRASNTCGQWCDRLKHRQGHWSYVFFDYSSNFRNTVWKGVLLTKLQNGAVSCKNISSIPTSRSRRKMTQFTETATCSTVTARLSWATAHFWESSFLR